MWIEIIIVLLRHLFYKIVIFSGRSDTSPNVYIVSLDSDLQAIQVCMQIQSQKQTSKQINKQLNVKQAR